MRGALIVFLALAVAGCLGPPCVNTVLEEKPSPDGERNIIVFSRDCGATTGFSTQGTILKRGQQLPNQAGNTFVIDHGGAKVAWESKGVLLVVFERGARIFKQEPAVAGVTVEYRSE